MSCFNIDLGWLNSTGGWEHFSFTAWKTYGYNISNVEIVKKDIFENWDTTFIAGKTESETISIESNETIIVRSQDLTQQQINAIARLRISIRVQNETNPDAIQTVIVNSNSFTYRTDNDKRYIIEFTINRPGEIIQSL